MSAKQPALDSLEKPLVEFIKSAEQLREQLQRYRGIRGAKIAQLPATATLADCINKVNEVIDLLQG